MENENKKYFGQLKICKYVIDISCIWGMGKMHLCQLKIVVVLLTLYIYMDNRNRKYLSQLKSCYDVIDTSYIWKMEMEST